MERRAVERYLTDSSEDRRLIKIAFPIKLMVAVLVAAATPLMVLSWLLLAMIFDPGFYLDTQRPREVDLYSGLGWDEIGLVNEGVALFFGDNQLSLAEALTQTGAPGDTFNERETLHMDDVRAIVNLFVTLRTLTTIIVLAGGLLLVLSGDGRMLTRSMADGSLAILLSILVLAAAAIVDFDWLFTQFHLISFTNDLWQLDPVRSRLLQLYPLEFWFTATLMLAVRLITALALIGVGGLAAGYVLGRRKS